MQQLVSSCSVCANRVFDVLEHREFPVFLGADAVTVPGDTVLCQVCGLISRSPLPTQAQLDSFYGLTDGPDQDGIAFTLMPEQLNGEARMDALRLEQASYLQKHWAGRSAGALLEIGCYEGHLLNVFRQRGWAAQGVELSRRASYVAKALHGLDVHEGTVNSLRALRHSFDAIVMVHVLEHVLDPLETLKACYTLLKPSGLLFIEVPDVERLPVSLAGSMFNFEHLYYFSPVTLMNALHSVSFEVVDLSIDIGYPAIRVLAAPSKQIRPLESDYARASVLYQEKLGEGKQLVDGFRSKLGVLSKQWIDNGVRLAIYGAGQHTKNLLELAGFDQVHIVGLVDSDPQKQGRTFFSYEVHPPSKIAQLAPDVILISSYAYQNEIYDSLKHLMPKVQVLRLYDQVFELEEYAFHLEKRKRAGDGP